MDEQDCRCLRMAERLGGEDFLTVGEAAAYIGVSVQTHSAG
jgi:hypothetical protein